ncbi:tetratricopeptide repeat protein, partial [Candidatus Binatus sp.]|uniref:tetratricopeptide repeat protein n=1 Tax=Candidatus Binatus sp. TaxID=2811406 RepID=UPI003CC592CD
VVVYLGYDLLNLQKYDELEQLTAQYKDLFPKEPDIPLLAGYVHKHAGKSDQALNDFTEALARDPNVVTAYVNRGYVLNDLHQPRTAASDFATAIKLEPKNGEAHLGLAYADLDTHRLSAAVRESQVAEQIMGDSEPVHLIRATAYGQEGMLTKATTEYRAALKFSPNDGSLHLALGSTLFSERHYHQAIDEFQTAAKLSTDNAMAYAMLARGYAELQDRNQTLRFVQLAEQRARQTPPSTKSFLPGQSELSEIFVTTGEALSKLGDDKAAMERFGEALTTPNSDRISVRLAIAQIMAHQDRDDDARRQIALALMEAQTGDTPPPTGEQLVEAADIFRDVHDFQLSQTYLQRAQAAGAPEIAVRTGMAQSYLALGDTARAQGELASLGNSPDVQSDYQYLLAEASVFRQEHHNAQALTAFAEATTAAGEDQSVQQNLLAAGADEGLRITPRLSVLSDFSVSPIFEDSTVYVLDAKLDGPTPVPSNDIALLPPPRSNLQTEGTGAYHLDVGKVPTITGFFQVRNSRGLISVPATNSIDDRDTTDYNINSGLNPTFHLGKNMITLNSGIQETIRRDSRHPADLNQNIFRVFTYLSTSSFFNTISASGYVLRESGPFTEMNLHSRTLTAAVDFRVGAPWGRTALVTGWGANDQLFTPTNFENYYTSSYVGLERHFTSRLDVRAIAEDLRAWRIVGSKSGIAQDLHPSGTINFALSPRWDLEGSGAYSNTRSFHAYDTIQDGFSVSYIRPFHRKFNAETGEVSLEYPIRFSAGFQQQTFFNFSSGKNQ